MSPGTTMSDGTPLTCEDVAVQNLTEKYVAGHLSEAEQAAFEQHYFSCPRCLEELKTCRALQAELVREPQVHATSTRPAPIWRWTALAASLLLATATALWLTARNGDVPLPSGARIPAAPTAAPLAPGEPASSPIRPRADLLADLGRVQAPRYQPPRLRSAGSIDPHFEQGMSHYAVGRYRQAIGELRLVTTTGSAAASHRFYLGIAHLMIGETESAIDQLNAVIAAGDTAYLEEARFFAAKALVRKDALPGAQRHLDEVIRLAGDREREARSLRDTLRAVDSGTSQ